MCDIQFENRLYLRGGESAEVGDSTLCEIHNGLDKCLPGNAFVDRSACRTDDLHDSEKYLFNRPSDKTVQVQWSATQRGIAANRGIKDTCKLRRRSARDGHSSRRVPASAGRARNVLGKRPPEASAIPPTRRNEAGEIVTCGGITPRITGRWNRRARRRRRNIYPVYRRQNCG